jgi:MtN3 and saliva related transmembrane protein
LKFLIAHIPKEVAKMHLTLIRWIGLAAGFLTTAAFVPQVAKCWRSRHTQDISLPFTAATAAGLALWLLYGIFLGEAPIILANSATLALVLTLLALKLRYH